MFVRFPFDDECARMLGDILLLFFLTLVVFSEEEKETPGVDAFVFLLRVFGVTTYSIIVCISTFLRAICLSKL